MRYLISIALLILIGTIDVSAQNKSATKKQATKRKTELATGWYKIDKPGKGVKRILHKHDEAYWLKSTPFLLAKNIRTIQPEDFTTGLSMYFDSTGTKQMADATARSGTQIGFVVKNKLIHITETIYPPIAHGNLSIIMEDYSPDEISDIIKEIRLQ